MEKITIAVVSRSSKLDKQDFLKNIDETCGIDYDMIFINNEKKISLSKLYSEIVNASSTEILILIHDDVEFIKNGWGREVYEMFQRNKDYGIIGVAGSSEFDNECAWWKYHDIYGQVLHKLKNKYWLSTFSNLFDYDLEEVCVIDGLFIAINKDRITYNFDENINGFDMYDIDFCLGNFLSNKTKIGVTTKIRLAHYSIGELSDEWFSNRELIRNKYKNYFPIKIKKNVR